MNLLISTVIGSVLAYACTELFGLSDITGFLVAGGITAAIQIYLVLNDGK